MDFVSRNHDFLQQKSWFSEADLYSVSKSRHQRPHQPHHHHHPHHRLNKHLIFEEAQVAFGSR